MAAEKPRLARLTSMLLDLQSKRMVTAAQLAKKYEVSIRTVYRDMRTLELTGIPIVVQEGKGYSLMEGYRLPPIMFTEEEAHALVTVEQMVNQNKDQSLVEQYGKAITKIRAVLKDEQQEKTELLSERIQVRGAQGKEKTSHFLMELQMAITKFELVELCYTSLKGEETSRRVEPFAVFTTQQNWILVAFCRLRNEFRAFRLDQIKEMQLLQKEFTPHEITLEEYFEACRKKRTNTPDTPFA